jgi:hypothetical protein
MMRIVADPTEAVPALRAINLHEHLDPNRAQIISERDQLWASLRQLLPEIRRLSDGQFNGSERERLLLQLLARIVAAEMQFRGQDIEEAHPTEEANE